MDADGGQPNLRQDALGAAAGVDWLPAWGMERIRGMLASRPDWCISRQRSWGVPIPALHCDGCGEAVLDPAVIDRAAAVFAEHGADAWYERPAETFIPDAVSCPACGGADFTLERDILDVWFDSGTSLEAVQADHPALGWPATVYLEGSDQYRGWFQSSLLVAVATRGGAPFEQVITHGFVVDRHGRKMSKSLGNNIEPQAIIDDSGAEVLRLWTAMVNYHEEIRIGPEIIARVVEAYRKIRNTLRILAANLFDFDPERHQRAVPDLMDVDRYAVACFGEVAGRVLESYERYDFQAVTQAVNHYLTVDLSAFYVDVSKDCLYTRAAGSPERRSAQTAMYLILDGLTRLLAPLLPVTADDLWRHLPGPRDESVHLTEFPTETATSIDHALMRRWTRLRGIRDTVNVEIERRRQDKTVGTSLEARVVLRASGSTATLLEAHRDDLPMVFITSAVDLTVDETFQPDNAATNGSVWREPEGAVAITVERAPGLKCDRCWRYLPALTGTEARAGICPRCVAALDADEEARS